LHFKNIYKNPKMNYLKKLFSSTFQKANPESLAKPSKTGDKNANKNEAV